MTSDWDANALLSAQLIIKYLLTTWAAEVNHGKEAMISFGLTRKTIEKNRV